MKIVDTFDFYSTAIFQNLSIRRKNMTKKKSIWAFVLAFMLVVPAMFLFSACGKHEHSFSSDWTKTESQHWHDCTDKNCEEKSDLADHDFVWVEKTPAGVHTDKVETGTCSTCKYQKDRTIEGSGIHTWEWKTSDTKHWQETTCEHETPLKQNEQDHTWERKSDATKHWEQTTCTQHETIKRNEEAHSWVWKANEHKHWQETTCEQGTPLKQNGQNHTWVYTSEGELTHQRTTNCGAEKHATRIEPNIPHRYDNVDDTTCNDCGNVRDLTGKGSFNALSAKTYNAGAQGVASTEYSVDEAIKDLCEIQYKVKGANDSTYTTTAPTNAGTYEVRIYCRGNATYLKGEVAKTEYVIKQIEVNVGVLFKIEKQTTSNNYITLETYEVTDVGLPSNVILTLRAYGEKYKNQGRYKLLKENDFEGLQFDNTNFKPIPTKNAKPQLSVSIIVYTNEAPVVIGTNQTEGNVKWISYATPPYPTITMYQITSGTLRVGDYLICEGVNIPLKVKSIKLNKGSASGSTSEFCGDIAVAGEIVDISFETPGFTENDAKTKLINTTFTKVDYAALTFNEGSNETNHLDVTLQQNESMYLEFTATVDSAKTFKLDFRSEGGYKAGESFEFYNAETGEKMTNNMNEVSVSAAGTYKIVIKITKVAAEYNYLYKTVPFYVIIK